MYSNHKAFTLIEVLISIALLSIVLLTLYRSLDMLRSSNRQLLHHLQKRDMEKYATQTLYIDISGSDGNITIERDDDYSKLCIESSTNSLYALPSAKVCWLVAKEDDTLLRVEGNNYKLPLDSEDIVSVDRVMSNIDIFSIYKNKDEVLVLLQQKGQKPISFIVYGVEKKKKKKKKVKKSTGKSKKGNNSERPKNPNQKMTQPPIFIPPS